MDYFTHHIKKIARSGRRHHVLHLPGNVLAPGRHQLTYGPRISIIQNTSELKSDEKNLTL